MSPARIIALATLALTCALALAACGGGSTKSPPSGPVGESSDGSTDTTTTDDPDARGSLNPLLDLCEVSELGEKASALYPDQSIKCYGGPSAPTPIHQISDAAWSAGEVNPRTRTISDEHTIQAHIEGNRPGEDDPNVSTFIYDGECYSAAGIQCEDREVKIEGTNCQLRRQVLEIGGPTIKTLQVGCRLGHDPRTDLDVRVQTAATKLESANEIQDFTAAIIRSVRDE